MSVSCHSGGVESGFFDEVTSIGVIQRLFASLDRLKFSGTVKALPLVNPAGFGMVKRELPFSDEDLNRCFPGDPRGTLGERVADR